ncbi:cAMP-dependent protein kinase catalytic subunit PRKX [Trichinella pseudospiralis]|uniref:cAMP-dependent protein kinase catalytic subunit PRKX n=1 Tax=Trichinella pseudospiralis TaxID=6337 RepID=A0A0V1F7D7_TRIPS|nr:cAMP-dependent protein kinase catalytic subunit PRKX [Trichinella pseudospiralis]
MVQAGVSGALMTTTHGHAANDIAASVIKEKTTKKSCWNGGQNISISLVVRLANKTFNHCKEKELSQPLRSAMPPASLPMPDADPSTATVDCSKLEDAKFSSTTTVQSVEEDDQQQLQQQQQQQQQQLQIDVDSKFERICTVGTGSYGRVYLARQRDSGKFYALKVMSFRKIVRSKQQNHVLSERKVLEKLNTPFAVKLHWAYHDAKCLYMLLDYVPGGELLSHIRFRKQFSNDVARFYAAEIVVALEYLHERGIVYRDLKPENVLIDRHGHIKLTDFGFAKLLNDRQGKISYSFMHNMDNVRYTRISGTRSSNWQRLQSGCGLVVTGKTPFEAPTAIELYQNIVYGDFKFTRQFERAARDIIRKFLRVEKSKRLGNTKEGVLAVKNHRWFVSVNWDLVTHRRLQPPINPKVSHDGDAGNYHEYEEIDLNEFKESSDEDMRHFVDWDYNISLVLDEQ